MQHWENFRIFNAIAKFNSIKQASEELKIHQSTISRHLKACERELGFPLFHRHARDLRLTQQGRMLLETTQRFDLQVQRKLGEIHDLFDKPAGLLRVHASVTLGSTFLAAHLRQFFHKYPDMRLTLDLSDSHRGDFWLHSDVMLRLHASQEPDLIERHVSTFKLNIYASKEYLADHPEPKEIAELDQHRIIAFGLNARTPIPEANWLVSLGRHDISHRTPILEVNNFTGIYRALNAGIGIGSLPEYVVQKNSSLQRILPQVPTPEVKVYYVYHISLRGSKRVIALRDYLQTEMQQLSNDL